MLNAAAWSAAACRDARSEEHTSEPSHVSISYAVFCLKKKNLRVDRPGPEASTLPRCRFLCVLHALLRPTSRGLLALAASLWHRVGASGAHPPRPTLHTG